MTYDPTPIGSGDHELDPIARRLRRALAQEAAMVHPSDDALTEITGRIGEQPRRPWVPWVAGLAAASVVGVVAGAVITSSRDDGGLPAGQPTVAATSSPSSPATPSDSPSPTAVPSGELKGMPVYWVGQSKTSVWLYREFRTVPDVGDPVASAVAAMTSLQPLDPDYSTPWRPASSVEVTRDGAALTVDLSADAFANTSVGSQLAERAVQQLVYTATAAAQTAGTPADTVTVTVDGSGYDAWGTVRLGEPMKRAPMIDVQASTWLLTPAQGATVPAGTVRFTGYGTAFEATFLWEVRDAAGTVVADGFTNGGSMGTFGEFAFSADLPAGRYTVEVYQPDESGGESAEGPRMFPDTKDFTVR